MPPLLLQPFVENAIWHGLMNSVKPTKEIRIDARRELDQMVITIIDNGIGGIKANNLSHNKFKKNMSLDRVKDRIRLLSCQMAKEIQFQIKDDMKNNQIQGTIVEIYIPLNNYRIDE